MAFEARLFPSKSDTPPPPHWLAALCGIATGAGAIALSSVVAATGRDFRSPVVDVGDRFIEVTPAWLKDLAISVFGTYDKLALLVGIAIVLTIFSAGIGLVAMRWRLVFGVLGIAAFGAVGAAAALGGGRGPGAVVPSLAGTIAGVLLLWWLQWLWFPGEGRPDDFDSRRRLLWGLAGAVLGVGLFGIAGIGLGRRLDISSTAAGRALPQVADPLPSVPNGVALDAPGLSPFVTSNADFYRIDTALVVPQIPAEEYRLRVFGMVDRELNLGYQDLLDLTQVESDITLTCVSNEVGGQLVGNARWQGVRLDEILNLARIDPTADQIVGRSYDDYTCGFPVSVVWDGRDALVALGMNGEPLPLEHGYPARLVVPGLYGYVSATKWLREIEVTTFAAFDQYWVARGWAEQAPIKTQSRIDTPGPLAQIPSGPSVIAGVAWAQTRGISKVEVRVDHGAWQEAALGVEISDTTWRQWKLDWEVTPGRHDLTVRATDGHGEVQTDERAAPMPDGSTGWHSIVVIGTAT